MLYAPQVIELEKPQLIVGVTGRKGTISEAAIRAMGKMHDRPMVFPLSNPTSNAEITPADAYAWTDGRAIVATGSPFDDVTYGSLTFSPSQCNNMCAAYARSCAGVYWPQILLVIMLSAPRVLICGCAALRRYIFPGVGLGASVCAAESVPDSMLYHAAVALSRMTTEKELAAGRVFPHISSIREVSLQVGTNSSYVPAV